MALTFNSTGVVIVDDTNPNIDYQPPSGWERNGVSQEYLGTTHGGISLAATATYHFNGTAVAVYGTVMQGALSNYVVDDAAPVFYNSPNPTIVSSTFRTLFYQSPVLKDGPHRLVITSLVNSSDNAIWFDFLLYQPSGSANSSVSSNSPTPSSTSAAPRGGANANANLTTIVGGLLGALVVVMIFFLLFLYKRLRVRPPSGQKIISVAESDWHVDPYPGPELSAVPPTANTILAPGHPKFSLNPSRASPGHNYGSSSSSSGSVLPGNRQHQDGGVRLGEASVPPSKFALSIDASDATVDRPSRPTGHDVVNDVTVPATAIPPAYSYRPD